MSDHDERGSGPKRGDGRAHVDEESEGTQSAVTSKAFAGQHMAGKTPEPPVARAQVEAEQERFDGLVNEFANPPREPGLERTP